MMISELSAIYIVGDLFEDSKYLRQYESKLAIGFLTWLLHQCATHGVALRILEGTPSHDHGQSEIIHELNLSINADAMYLSGIGVMYDKAIGATIGWVQDEYRGGVASETEREFEALMKSSGYSELEFMFMHGVFGWQLPIDSPRNFNEEFWTRITRSAIYIGHDHRPKEKGIIRVTGSVERLSQNENEDKGVTVSDYDGTTVRSYFVINERSVLQLTVRASDDYEQQLLQSKEYIERILRHPSAMLARLNIEHYHDAPIAANIAEWAKRHQFKITAVKVDRDTDVEALDKAFEDDAVAVETISPDNAERIMLEALDGVAVNEDIVIDVMRRIV